MDGFHHPFNKHFGGPPCTGNYRPRESNSWVTSPHSQVKTKLLERPLSPWVWPLVFPKATFHCQCPLWPLPPQSPTPFLWLSQLLPSLLVLLLLVSGPLHTPSAVLLGLSWQSCHHCLSFSAISLKSFVSNPSARAGLTLSPQRTAHSQCPLKSRWKDEATTVSKTDTAPPGAGHIFQSVDCP